MTSLVERGHIITMVQEAMDSGARQDRACAVISLSERTLQRWQVDQSRGEQCPGRAKYQRTVLARRTRRCCILTITAR